MPFAASPHAKLAQMNTRIEADLKRQGDAALARAGYSPSQAVRALWSFAARNAHAPSDVADMLRTLDGLDGPGEKERRERKAAAARQGRGLYESFLASCGLGRGVRLRECPEQADAYPYGAAIAQRYEERGLL